jgi:hypothetical protein
MAKEAYVKEKAGPLPCFEDPWKPQTPLVLYSARLATLWVAGGPPETRTYNIWIYETWSSKTWTYAGPIKDRPVCPRSLATNPDRTFLPN